MNRAKIFIFILTGFLCLLTACEDDEPRLTRYHNKLLDSLTQERRVGLRAELDSLCDVLFADEIDRMTDSILQERMSEIRRKIEADAKKY